MWKRSLFGRLQGAKKARFLTLPALPVRCPKHRKCVVNTGLGALERFSKIVKMCSGSGLEQGRENRAKKCSGHRNLRDFCEVRGVPKRAPKPTSPDQARVVPQDPQSAPSAVNSYVLCRFLVLLKWLQRDLETRSL